MSDRDSSLSGPGPLQKAPYSAGELAELVLERLGSLDGLSSLEAGHDDVGWWRKRTRMVLESAAEADGRFRGVLSAFDSLKIGRGKKGREGGDLGLVGYAEEIEKARTLLRNLIKEMGDFPGRPSDEKEPRPKAPIVADSAGAQKAAARAPGDPAGEMPSLVPEIQNVLNEIVEGIERHAGLSPNDRNDCRLDVRSLRNELLKSHPNRGRVMSLLEALAFLDVDFSEIRRVV